MKHEIITGHVDEKHTELRCLRCGNNANFDTPKGGKLVEIKLIDKAMGDCHPTPAQQKAWDQAQANAKIKSG